MELPASKRVHIVLVALAEIEEGKPPSENFQRDVLRFSKMALGEADEQCIKDFNELESVLKQHGHM